MASQAIMIKTIDTLVGIEDALEAIGSQSLSRDQYVALHSVEHQAQAGEHYDHAQYRIRKHLTVRKALNDVRRKLETFRN